MIKYIYKNIKNRRIMLMLNYANIKISENDEEKLIGNILIDEDGWI